MANECTCHISPPCSFCTSHYECEHCGELVHEDDRDDHACTDNTQPTTNESQISSSLSASSGDMIGGVWFPKDEPSRERIGADYQAVEELLRMAKFDLAELESQLSAATERADLAERERDDLRNKNRVLRHKVVDAEAEDWFGHANQLSADIDKLGKENADLTAQLDTVKKERDEARDFGNRWMKAALYATPITTDAFDPMNPEAFAESRRRAVDTLMSERDVALARAAKAEQEFGIVKQNAHEYRVRCDELMGENVALRTRLEVAVADSSRFALLATNPLGLRIIDGNSPYSERIGLEQLRSMVDATRGNAE